MLGKQYGLSIHTLACTGGDRQKLFFTLVPPHIPDFAVLLVLQLVLLVALLPLLTVLAPIGVMSVDGAGV